VLETLDHVIVGVRELEAATASYVALLGRDPSWRGAHPGYGTANTLFRLDNTYLELLAPVGEGPFGAIIRGRLDRDGEGLFGLAFGTSDGDATARELRDRGLAVADPAPGEGRDERTGAVRRWRNAVFPEAQMRGVFSFAIEHRSPADALPPARAAVDAQSAISGLDHVVVHTRDPDASSRLYGEVLGLRLALDRSLPAFGARLLFFRIGGITVEVAAKLDAAPEPEASDRLGGLAWTVPDVEAARVRLARIGFDVSEVRTGRKAGTCVCTVRDRTHGVPTLLIGPDAG
jgi:catechol 2,3-dioxygenase-like lactoylglutathione lyase family enzyme